MRIRKLLIHGKKCNKTGKTKVNHKLKVEEMDLLVGAVATGRSHKCEGG